MMESKPAEGVGTRGWSLCRRLLCDQIRTHRRCRTVPTSISSSEESPRDEHQHDYHHLNDIGNGSFVKTVTKALLHRRRLSFEPDKKLYFPYEPGKQATSAIRIKNVCRSRVAFKFQTTAPKTCFMRPPSGVLSPGESVVATVVKRIYHPKRVHRDPAKDKFKIVSLKMVEGEDFDPELFDERKDLVAVEQVLRVQFLDPQQQAPELEKLKMRIAEAGAAVEACKKPAVEEAPPVRLVGKGSILEEWNKMKMARRLMKADPL